MTKNPWALYRPAILTACGDFLSISDNRLRGMKRDWGVGARLITLVFKRPTTTFRRPVTCRCPVRPSTHERSSFPIRDLGGVVNHSRPSAVLCLGDTGEA